MPLTGQISHDLYKITLIDGENLDYVYIVAENLEEAAWLALRVAIKNNANLKDVIKVNGCKQEILSQQMESV